MTAPIAATRWRERPIITSIAARMAPIQGPRTIVMMTPASSPSVMSRP